MTTPLNEGERAMKMLRSKLYERKLEEQAKHLAEIRGEQSDIAWGSQIRSYVFHPYSMVKDHRTKFQVGDVNRVLDGDIDVFIKSFLMKRSSGTLGAAESGDDDEAV